MTKKLREQIIQAAINEIDQKKLGHTSQFLGVHDVVRIKNVPKVHRIAVHQDQVVVYFPVVDNDFFFSICVNPSSIPTANWVYVESGVRISLRATSKTLPYKKLASVLSLKPLTGHNVGDTMPHNPKAKERRSTVDFEPLMETAYPLEEKLNMFLDELENDKKGIQKLTALTETWIQATMYSYISNGLIGGVNLDPKTLKRLSDLNLTIDFNFWVTGTAFKA